jgi:FMN phosphatase YigB (HAD superfamily)
MSQRLFSFDIDGTLETGDPPGQVSIEVVRRALGLGFIVGSCSDRPLSVQQRMWDESGIEVHFTVLKQHLLEVRAQFIVDQYLHIGDTPIDRMMALEAGFDFVHSIEDDVPTFLQSHGLL